MTEAGEQTTARRRTWRKSEHKPKHPLNAYNVFFQFQRERILNHQANAPINIEEVAKIQISQEKKKRKKGKKSQQSAPGVKVGFADLARTIASKWKQLGDETKAAFEKHAEQEKIRYKQELEQWAATKDKGGAEDDTAAVTPQLDDSSILSLGTPLPLQMEDETVAPQPVSPQMFRAKHEVEVPRTVAFYHSSAHSLSNPFQMDDETAAPQTVSPHMFGAKPEVVEVPRTIAFEKKGKQDTVDRPTACALEEQMGDNPNDTRHSIVTPVEDQVAFEGQKGSSSSSSSSSMMNEEQEMRKMLQHHTREMNLIASKLNEMENNRFCHPAMSHNLGGACCAACASKTANANSFPNPNMFNQGAPMMNMGMGMNMGHPSLQVMQNNNGMMSSLGGFNNFGPNPAAAGFGWDPLAMQTGGMPAANGFDFSPNCFPTNGQINGGAWDGNGSTGVDPSGASVAAEPRRISM